MPYEVKLPPIRPDGKTLGGAPPIPEEPVTAETPVTHGSGAPVPHGVESGLVTPHWQIIQADARRIPLRDRLVQCVVTSPPYWGLRDYGLEPIVWGGDADCAHVWCVEKRRGQTGGTGELSPIQTKRREPMFGPVEYAFCAKCSAWRGSLGLEPTPDLFVKHLVQIFREVRRVLRDDGTVWLILGDSYASSTKSEGQNDTDKMYPGNPEGLRSLIQFTLDHGLKPKDLVGIPWRVALALQNEGWYLRSDIIWSKPNPMPESVKDRPTKAHEYIFLLTKSQRYYYDQDAVRNLHKHPGELRRAHHTPDGRRQGSALVPRAGNNPAGRNRRTVWEIPIQAFPEAHFATFPEALVEPWLYEKWT